VLVGGGDVTVEVNVGKGVLVEVTEGLGLGVEEGQ
jgi:hypothetical protein